MTKTMSLAERSFSCIMYSLMFVTICKFPLEISYMTLKMFITYSRCSPTNSNSESSWRIF